MANKALAITEVVENILLQIDDPWALLSAWRVSSKFRQIINISDSLQKKLSMRPATSFGETESLGMIGDDSLILCPGDSGSDVKGGFAVLNPFILDVKCDSSQHSDLKLRKNVLRDTIASRRRLSSWGAMYISQPPL